MYKRFCGPDCILVCNLGSQETLNFQYYLIDKHTQLASGRIPVGYSMAGMTVVVVDEKGRPVDANQLGEITVHSRHLSPGYWRQPELTAEKFWPDPDGGDQRVYRTGDLGYMQPDGCLFHVGRKDFRVKIRGYTVEPAEIELALLNLGTLKEAVVISYTDHHHMEQLAAYIVPQVAPSPSVTSLRQRLSQTLPDYMIPAVFIGLDALPQLPNGKVDRTHLPPPSGARPRLGHAYVAPRTDLERLLTSMWQDILGIQPVGIHDHFFDLGGDSIRAMMLMNRLQAELNEFLQFVAIFDAPTVAEMVTYLHRYYARALSQQSGISWACLADPYAWPGAESSPRQIKAETVERFHNTVLTPFVSPTLKQTRLDVKNRAAIFILSPPSSGSTLLRVLMAGHPRLFAPPELHLLSYHTLAERRVALARTARQEGVTRALMALLACDASEATQRMAHYEAQNLTTWQCYDILQARLGDRTLVDKTPEYSYHLGILHHAEAWFQDALYIHLLRHPYGMIQSSVDVKMELGLPLQTAFPPHQVAELCWLISHQNILRFLNGVPQGRQHRVHFEALVTTPRAVVEELCDFLRLAFHPDMLQPYHHQHDKMVDGIHAVSRMTGDMKFHTHNRIDASVADRWQQVYRQDFLHETTWQVAAQLGYQRELCSAATPSDTAMAGPHSVRHLEQLVTELEALSDQEVQRLVQQAGSRASTAPGDLSRKEGQCFIL